MKINMSFQGARWIAAGVVVACLTACNPAPKYAKPPAQTPNAFKEAVPQQYKEGTGWKLAQPGDDHLRGKWWEVYKDPQLSALEEQVAISNQNIAVAEANFRAARSLVAYARSSLFPNVSTAPSYSNSRISQTSRNTNFANGVPNLGILNNFSVPISVSYEVDLWHRIRNTIAANAYQAQASAADVATALLSTQAELAQNYFQIRALDVQRGILRETVANYRETLSLNVSRFSGGIASNEEVSQAQTQLDTVIAQQTDVSVARGTYEHAIATLIGKPPAEFALPVAPFTPNPPPVPIALPSELLERRPDIASSERRVAAANAQIGVARAAYYPRLDLGFSGGLQSSQISQWFTWPSHFWSLGPTLGETVFDAGARRALNEQAQANYDAAVATYRQTVLGVFQAVEDNLSTLRVLSREIAEERTAVNSANRYLDLSLVRYRGGVDSYLNVVTAQNLVLTNRETEVGIQLRQMLSSVALILALGGGWDTTQLPKVQQLAAKGTKQQQRQAPGTNPSPQPIAAPNPPPLQQ